MQVFCKSVTNGTTISFHLKHGDTVTTLKKLLSAREYFDCPYSYVQISRQGTRRLIEEDVLCGHDQDDTVIHVLHWYRDH